MHIHKNIGVVNVLNNVPITKDVVILQLYRVRQLVPVILLGVFLLLVIHEATHTYVYSYDRPHIHTHEWMFTKSIGYLFNCCMKLHADRQLTICWSLAV